MMRSARVVGFAAVLLIALLSGWDQRVRVSYFGDSLGLEAGGAFGLGVSSSGRATVQVHAAGGTAPCDWLRWYADRLRHLLRW